MVRSNFIFPSTALERNHLLTISSILVVEDDAIIALRNYELLTKSGYTVPDMFAVGEELFDHLEHSELPDLNLMEIGLIGEIDGIETARRVRERYDIPVIFVTFYVDDERRARAKEIPAQGYIVNRSSRARSLK